MAPPRGRPAASKVSSPSDTSMVDAEDHEAPSKQDEMDATVSLLLHIRSNISEYSRRHHVLTDR